jgi:hypothetical protein
VGGISVDLGRQGEFLLCFVDGFCGSSGFEGEQEVSL